MYVNFPALNAGFYVRCAGWYPASLLCITPIGDRHPSSFYIVPQIAPDLPSRHPF